MLTAIANGLLLDGIGMFGHGLIRTRLRFEGVEFVQKACLVGCDPLLNGVVELECGLEIEPMLLAPIAGEVLGEFLV